MLVNWLSKLLKLLKIPSLDLDDIRRRRQDKLPTHISNFLRRRNKREVTWHNPCEEHYHLNPKCYAELQKASFNCHNNPRFPGSEFYRKLSDLTLSSLASDICRSRMIINLAQYCPQLPQVPGNNTVINCGPNWPYKHTDNDVTGLAPCLTKEDMEENFPCSSTRNINWFLNTMNDCFSESNIIVNQDNFMDVLGNSHFYNSK